MFTKKNTEHIEKALYYHRYIFALINPHSTTCKITFISGLKLHRTFYKRSLNNYILPASKAIV